VTPNQDKIKTIVALRYILLALYVAIALVILSGCSTTVVYKAPPLADPPLSVVDALEQAGRKDPSAAAWTIDLDRHYQKLDAINSTKGYLP
jgi:uncharacterized protein YceK